MMKYDILDAFREHLNAVLDNKNTADAYYFAVEGLFKDLQFNGLSEIPRETIEERLTGTRTKNRFSAARNGLKHLKSFEPSLNMPPEAFFRETAKSKKNFGVLPSKTLNHDNICRKVNAIRDPKLKTAYRLMMSSGLRVSETAALEKRDISIEGDIIKIDVKHGKGGSNDVVTCQPDKWLSGELAKMTEPLDDGKKPFYSAQTMKNKAGKLGLECHDFRRVAAITFRDAKRDEGEERIAANEETRDYLRHARFSVTKRYLRNKKLKFTKKPHRKYGKRLTKKENGDIIRAGSENMPSIHSPIENPIEQRNTGKGVPPAVLHFDRELNNRQKALLDNLPDYDSRVTVPKNSVNMKDLSALTAKTGVEFAMFTKGQERLIVRGSERKVNVSPEYAKELSEKGFRWSGHTHPGFSNNCLDASDGDYIILGEFNQEQSVVYNSLGNFSSFKNLNKITKE
jgi:integrase